mmetsp:Transcript_4277/g.10283  ORF Transcript_4277/g.10283 Transcript_4277/m.10283 type:complete len:238 (-) Transcript_4277:659-1372(-)
MRSLRQSQVDFLRTKNRLAAPDGHVTGRTLQPPSRHKRRAQAIEVLDRPEGGPTRPRSKLPSPQASATQTGRFHRQKQSCKRRSQMLRKAGNASQRLSLHMAKQVAPMQRRQVMKEVLTLRRSRFLPHQLQIRRRKRQKRQQPQVRARLRPPHLKAPQMTLTPTPPTVRFKLRRAFRARRQWPKSRPTSTCPGRQGNHPLRPHHDGFRSRRRTSGCRSGATSPQMGRSAWRFGRGLA